MLNTSRRMRGISVAAGRDALAREVGREHATGHGAAAHTPPGPARRRCSPLRNASQRGCSSLMTWISTRSTSGTRRPPTAARPPGLRRRPSAVGLEAPLAIVRIALEHDLGTPTPMPEPERLGADRVGADLRGRAPRPLRAPSHHRAPRPEPRACADAARRCGSAACGGRAPAGPQAACRSRTAGSSRAPHVPTARGRGRPSHGSLAGTVDRRDRRSA